MLTRTRVSWALCYGNDAVAVSGMAEEVVRHARSRALASFDVAISVLRRAVVVAAGIVRVDDSSAH